MMFNPQNNSFNKKSFLTLSLFLSFFLNGQNFDTIIEEIAIENESEIIELRHWFHQNAELSNREFKTAEKISEALIKIGLEPKTGIAKTGVVAVLKGGKPGPVVALRADIDGLPVKERADLPWKSNMFGVYNGEKVPVMHACGHDTHTAILLGVARVLYTIKDDIPGSIKFIFQPAEEGAPAPVPVPVVTGCSCLESRTKSVWVIRVRRSSSWSLSYREREGRLPSLSPSLSLSFSLDAV